MSNNTASKVPNNLFLFPTGVMSSCDLPDTNSGKTKSHGEETYEVKNQPILPAQLQKDLVNLSPNQLAKAYPSEYGSYNSRKRSLKKQCLTMPPEYSKFRGFLNSIGINPYPGHYSVHRIDNDNPLYFPGGIKWASRKEQNNAKGDTIQLTIGGVTKPLTVLLDENPELKENSVRNRWRKRDEKGYTDYQILYGAKASPPGSTDSSDSPPTSAINCNPVDSHAVQTPGPFSEASPEDSHNQSVQPTSRYYRNMFKSEVEDVYDEKVVGLTNSHEYMLKRVANELSGVGIPASEAIRSVIRFWPQFTAYADEHYGCFKPPLKPTPEYISRAVRAMPIFYEARGKRLIRQFSADNPKIWKKLLRGCGKKFRKQAETNYVAHRKTTNGVTESRVVWLIRCAESHMAPLEDHLSENWGGDFPEEQYQHGKWSEVLARTQKWLDLNS